MSVATLGAVVLASLLGSVHCMAMCGGFATAVVGDSGWRATAAYQLGRLLSYLGLGAAAAVLGASLDGAAMSLVGLQGIASVVTGSVLIAMGVHALWPRRAGGDALVSLGARAGRPGILRRLSLAGLRHGGPAGAAAIGLASALLPCGWLWGYVLVAGSTTSVLPAMAVMAAFWAGGLPALLSVGTLAVWLRRTLGPAAPRLVAALMIALGVLALAGKLGPSVSNPSAASAPAAPSCH